MRPTWPAHWPDEHGNDTRVLRHGRPRVRSASRRLATALVVAVLAGVTPSTTPSPLPALPTLSGSAS
jgi:hypothetical protein